jgi:branched-subunit amino acid aminotransferase/4-amino-4-deoxychorismate lyase
MPEPRSAVWSAIAWDGRASLLAADMHFARIHRHATVLGIQTPDNLAKRVFETLNDLELPVRRMTAQTKPPSLSELE